MSDPKIVRRPKCMNIGTEGEFNPTIHESLDVWCWARHLESRLAKYETHHPDPKPGEASVVKHTAYDPDRRPAHMTMLDTANMNEVPNSLAHYAAGYTRAGASEAVLLLYAWTLHLESVREGLQRTINHFERMYQNDHAPRPDGEEQN